MQATPRLGSETTPSFSRPFGRSSAKQVRKRAAVRRASRATVERMEERVLLTNANLPLATGIDLTQIGTDIQSTLTSAQTDVTPLLDHPLPIIGSKLGDAVTSLSDLATKLNNALTNGQNQISWVESALASALGPSGAGILPLTNGQFPSADEVSTPDSTTNPTEITRVEFKLPLTQTAQVVNSSLAFSTGLPGLNLTTSGSIVVSVGYTFQLDFGYDSTQGFFIDTT